MVSPSLFHGPTTHRICPSSHHTTRCVSSDFLHSFPSCSPPLLKACSTARLVTRHIITNALRALCELTGDSELAEPAYPVFAPTELTKLDGEGRSALSLAIQMGNRADVRALLTYGTPFDVAMLHDRVR